MKSFLVVVCCLVCNNNELDDTNNAVDDDDDKIRTKRNINIKSMFFEDERACGVDYRHFGKGQMEYEMMLFVHN